MKRSLRRALWAGAVVAVTVAAVPVTTAFGAGTVTTTFTKAQDWGTGHEAKVTVTNGSSATVTTWRIEFDLPSGTTISSAWDADVTSSGNHYVAVKKSWAGGLAPGASFSWGYNGTGAYKAPLNCTVNGAACGGGTTPPTTTPPTTTPPTTTPPTTHAAHHATADHRPAEPGWQEGRRLLRRVGRLRPQLPRQEHPDQRLGRQADPHPVRLRQHHRRSLLDR